MPNQRQRDPNPTGSSASSSSRSGSNRASAARSSGGGSSGGGAGGLNGGTDPSSTSTNTRKRRWLALNIRRQVENRLEAKDLMHARETEALEAHGLHPELPGQRPSRPRQQQYTDQQQQPEPVVQGVVQGQPVPVVQGHPIWENDPSTSIDTPPSRPYPKRRDLRHRDVLPSNTKLWCYRFLAFLGLAVVIIVPTVLLYDPNNADEEPEAPITTPGPTRAPVTPPPTLRPTAAPTPAPFFIPPRKAFTSTSELYDAVDAYLLNSSPIANVSQTYGWPMGQWNVSLVEDFSRLFDATPLARRRGNVAAATFNEELGLWDMSRATSLQAMFSGAALFTSDLSNWNVERVTDFSSMFKEAAAFQSDLSRWQTSSAITMWSLFEDAKAFDSDIKSDLSRWDVSQVTTLSRMFRGASSFSQNLCGWGLQIENLTVTTVGGMFSNSACPVQETPDLTAIPPGPFCFECT